MRSAAALPAPRSTELARAPASSITPTAVASMPPVDRIVVDETDPEPRRLRSLPPAVADRLKSLLSRHDKGKTLSAAERAEAQGLLDIAEYFAIKRMRGRLR